MEKPVNVYVRGLKRLHEQVIALVFLILAVNLIGFWVGASNKTPNSLHLPFSHPFPIVLFGLMAISLWAKKNPKLTTIRLWLGPLVFLTYVLEMQLLHAAGNTDKTLVFTLTATAALALVLYAGKHLPAQIEHGLFMLCMTLSMFALMYWPFSQEHSISFSDPLTYQLLAWVGVTQGRVFQRFLVDIDESYSKRVGLWFLMTSPFVLLAFSLLMQLVVSNNLFDRPHLVVAVFSALLSSLVMFAVFRYTNVLAYWEKVHRQGLHSTQTELRKVIEELDFERVQITALNEKLNKELHIKSTSLQDAVETLMAQQMNAKAAYESKSRFLGTVSHEIRGPLSAIVNLAGLIKAAPADETPKLAGKLELATRHLDALLTDILEMNKLTLGKTVLKQEPMNLESVIGRMIEWVGPVAKDKGLYLRMAKKSAPPCHVLGDELRLRQIVLNLVNNAVKFTRFGGVEISLNFQPVNELETDVEIKVDDTGPGIAQDRLNAIFAPFVQEHEGIAKEFGGFGLGLAIVRELLGLMGGTLVVDTTKGFGTTFLVRLRLPLVKPLTSMPTPQPEITAMPDQLPSGTFKGLKVLVVDDTALNRDVTRWVLESLGCEVAEADSGNAAIELLCNHVVHVVLMDLNMPGENGIDTTVRIRRNPKTAHVPIVGLSGSDNETDATECMRVGMQDYLIKPLDPTELKESLAQIGVWPARNSIKIHADCRQYDEESTDTRSGGATFTSW
ncbi:ATP-binding response regulator [Limnobacter litoralis]|uniref:histidine kinase n=1 Tax=Limnobacter litoralis TaxID=481366 RepID=A0ABQ5YPV6_9BURK|nr:response regulator [Limnobacter litoralis]GLR26643.1 hypothetical protein GCM10007875_17330 [Limnobacter litoralis]